MLAPDDRSLRTRLDGPPRGRALTWLGLCAAAALAASCSVLYNPDDLGVGSDGGLPPGVPDARPPDALPAGAFGLIRSVPATVREGEGAVRPIPVVIEGQNISPDVEISVMALDDVILTAPVVNGAGTRLAFGMTVPVIDVGAPDSFTIVARQNGEERMVTVGLVSLDELVASKLSGGRLSQDDVNALDCCSRIVIDASVILEGDEPVRLTATAEVVVSASISANGGDAVAANPGQPGPGGCRGGGLSADGECGGSGGQAPNDPTSNDAAGGGGHITPGIPGGGDSGADGGDASGSADLVPLSDEGGHGGGGSKQGAGGGGGGVFEITSEGVFRVDIGGNFSARGGGGGDGRCDAVSVGGGGGGSGGGILLRGLAGFEDLGSTPRIAAGGGAGGDTGTCLENGGGGADGRVRVDYPEVGDQPPFARTSRRPVRGPTIAPTLPVIVEAAGVAVPIAGQPDATYRIFVNGSGVDDVPIDQDGVVNVPVTLVEGRNELCVGTENGSIGNQPSEGKHCVHIAYMAPPL
ncbi:hypothetical protein [Haliangium sp.]|uniref:hypothetical protein n=1 Tax=Haliangium sp. TaxID=2663208 RepID=UPI003D114ADF